MSQELPQEAPSALDILPLETVVPVMDSPALNIDPIKAGERLQKDTFVLELHIRRPGFTRPIPAAEFIRKIKEAGEQALTPDQEQLLAQYKASITQQEGTDGQKTDTTMLHVSQDILDRREIAKIVNFDDKFSAWVKAQSIPCPMLAAGMYVMRLTRADEIKAAIQAFTAQRQVFINHFEANYASLQEEAKKRRWPFYDQNDYPEWNIIGLKYSVEWRYVSFNVPEALKTMNDAIYAEQQQKSKQWWADAFTEAMNAQRYAFQGLLEHFKDMLGRDEKGKRKTFRPTAVKKLQTFLETFQEINITGDIELESIINQTKQVLAGVDPSSLKKDGDLRDTMESSFAAITEAAKGLVVTKERKVVFEDTPSPPSTEQESDDDALPLV